jgi:cobalt/nickel transport system permease protein
LKRRFQATTAAHVGLAAAFVFLLQMFNVPIVGGTSGHAVGTGLVAIVLGPGAAVISTSLALALQALVFGDGGLWAYGANVITMAVLPAGVAWAVWQWVSPGAGRRRMGAVAFAAGYFSAVCGALLTGTLLGLQPILFKGANGLPHYFPLGLEVSIPAMVGSHLVVGLVEGAVTLGAVLALARMPEFKLQQALPSSGRRKIASILACMVVLAPIGIVLPGIMKSGEPWGEWSPEETARVASQPKVPEGMARHADKYKAPVADYQFAETATITGESSQYVGAALLGVLLVGLICLPLSRLQQARLRGKS